MKKEIHIPEELHRGIEECPDYPPRRLIQFLPIQLDPSTERSNPIKLRVDGLDFERYFNITVPSKSHPVVLPASMEIRESDTSNNVWHYITTSKEN